MTKIKGTTGSLGSKDEFDKFYTKVEVVEELLSEMNLELSDFDCIVEPSAGSGAFSNYLIENKSNNQDIYSFDLKPEGEHIVQADWFTLDKNIFRNYNNILVVGNPPYGRQNSLALDFIKESANFADYIAFILPKSFKKVSVQNKVPLGYWLIEEVDIKNNSFTLNGDDYDVPTVFQVWERRHALRDKVKLKSTSEYLEFTTADKANLRIQRVGGNAGKASLDVNVSKQSNYFIKNKSELSDVEFVDLINSIRFVSIDYTVGPKSLSKGELIYELEKYMESN